MSGWITTRLEENPQPEKIRNLLAPDSCFVGSTEIVCVPEELEIVEKLAREGTVIHSMPRAVNRLVHVLVYGRLHFRWHSWSGFAASLTEGSATASRHQLVKSPPYSRRSPNHHFCADNSNCFCQALFTLRRTVLVRMAGRNRMERTWLLRSFSRGSHFRLMLEENLLLGSEVLMAGLSKLVAEKNNKNTEM